MKKIYLISLIVIMLIMFIAPIQLVMAAAGNISFNAECVDYTEGIIVTYTNGATNESATVALYPSAEYSALISGLEPGTYYIFVDPADENFRPTVAFSAPKSVTVTENFTADCVITAKGTGAAPVNPNVAANPSSPEAGGGVQTSADPNATPAASAPEAVDEDNLESVSLGGLFGSFFVQMWAKNKFSIVFLFVLLAFWGVYKWYKFYKERNT
ncbi:MAG: hypothetical protein LBM38_00865 [Clostridiales bacterium]|nr:hypothetical protein [Clostridiales bacterium]